MRKLHELGILDRITVLSTISGGSITGAAYCLREGDFLTFEKYMTEQLTTKSVIRSVLLSWYFIRTALLVILFVAAAVYVLFTKLAWLSPILIVVLILLLVIFQFKIFPASIAVENAYNKFFFKNKTLKDMPPIPVIAIGASDTQIARPFTFSGTKMGSGTYKSKFDHRNFPVARAVMASSCVPFAFTPVHIDEEFYLVKDPADPWPQLVDGGVYDNQGLHKLTQKKSSYMAQTIVVSDAGNRMPFANSFNNVFVLLIRTMNIFMERIKRFQMITSLYENTVRRNREIAYISLGWDLDGVLPGFINALIDKNVTASVIAAHYLLPEWVEKPKENEKAIVDHLKKRLHFDNVQLHWPNKKELLIARSVGTNLTKLSSEQVRCLTKQAYVLTGIQVALYCPSLVTFQEPQS
jgi:NTE family protein